jgi:integrase
VEEAILHGDFFADDYEPSQPPSTPPLPAKRGRPRKHPAAGSAKTSNKVPGVFRVGNTLKTRVQFKGHREQVDLKTDKWEVARERKGQIDGMVFNGKFLGKCPPITLKNAWDRFKATQQGQVEPSTFKIYVASIEKKVLPLFGNMHLHLMDNRKVDLLVNDYQGFPAGQAGMEGSNTSEIELMARLYGLTPEGRKPWEPNATSHNKGGANLLLANLKVFFYWCLENGLIDKMPFTNQKLPHQMGARPYVSYKQIRPFLDAVERNSRAKDLVLACRIGIMLGLRSDEIRRSEWWWIDFDGCTFTPRDTKGKECSAIPIPPHFMKALRQEFQLRGEPLEDLIFPRIERKEVGTRQAGLGPLPTKTKTPTLRMRKRGQKRLESELRPKGFLASVVASAGRYIMKHGLTPHRLRATFATLHALAGTPIRDIQAMLRHKHIGTTILYIEDIPEIRHMAQTRMEKLAGFGELGQADVQNLRSWSEDLTTFLQGASPSMGAVLEGEEAPTGQDPRLFLAELAVHLERLVNATRAA